MAQSASFPSVIAHFLRDVSPLTYPTRHTYPIGDVLMRLALVGPEGAEADDSHLSSFPIYILLYPVAAMVHEGN